jgi:chromosome segregation ATPase
MIISKRKYNKIFEELGKHHTENKLLQEKIQEYEFEISRLNSEIKNKNKLAFDLNNEKVDLLQANKCIGNKLDELDEKLQQEKAKNRKLKALCTRNKVDYEHLFKEEK